jgi:hypothetical protein
MGATLREELVAELEVTVSVASELDREPHDVYLLEVALPTEDGPGADGPGEGGPGPGGPHADGPGAAGFDEAPFLEDLEPLLAAAGPSPQWAVDVSRTHRSDEGARGRARVLLVLAPQSDPGALPAQLDLTAAVHDAFARVAARSTPLTTPVALSHEAALAEARAAVARLLPGLDSRDLGLTDEEHHAVEGSWSLGLALPGVARFRVRVGLVAGVPHSVHVRRMPVGEVVDSVGT